MMDGLGPVVIAVMVVMMVVMCGGMIVGAGWEIRLMEIPARRWRWRQRTRTPSLTGSHCGGVVAAVGRQISP